MRVLVVHNRYRSALPSGENLSVDDHVALLRHAGIEVETFIRDSDEIEAFSIAEKAKLPFEPLYSTTSIRSFRRRLVSFRPDVVHVENVYPLISPWVIRVADQLAIPVVSIVRSYRHGCIAGSCFRGQQTCTDCFGRTVPWPAVLHGCYRGSRWQSVSMAASQVLHRNTWQRVSLFLPVSEFLAASLRNTGVDDGQILVKPNFVFDPGPMSALGEGFLFLGRLERQKGIRVLIDAWAASGLGNRSTLTIAGDGPERAWVETQSTRVRGLQFLGAVPRSSVDALIRSRAVIVVPSLVPETFGRVVLEAFSHGRPVIATDVGALPELVDETTGWLAPPDVKALASCLVKASAKEAAARVQNARQRFEEGYTPEKVLNRLLDAYDIARRRVDPSRALSQTDT